MNRKLFKFKTAGLVVLGLFLMISVLTLTFAFTNNSKGDTSAKKLVNPQWFTYNLDPTHVDFDLDKLDPNNYSVTNNTDPEERPCPDEERFCSIYAGTTLSGKPDFSPMEPIVDVLDTYHNGDGDGYSELIDEQIVTP